MRNTCFLLLACKYTFTKTWKPRSSLELNRTGYKGCTGLWHGSRSAFIFFHSWLCLQVPQSTYGNMPISLSSVHSTCRPLFDHPGEDGPKEEVYQILQEDSGSLGEGISGSWVPRAWSKNSGFEWAGPLTSVDSYPWEQLHIQSKGISRPYKMEGPEQGTSCPDLKDSNEDRYQIPVLQIGNIKAPRQDPTVWIQSGSAWQRNLCCCIMFRSRIWGRLITLQILCCKISALLYQDSSQTPESSFPVPQSTKLIIVSVSGNGSCERHC